MYSKTVVNQLTANLSLTGSQADAIVRTLRSGREFSVTEARDAGIKNPTAVVSKLRDEGYQIYSNPRRCGGQTVNRYRLNPARSN